MSRTMHPETHPAARAYDAFTAGSDYEAWTANVEPLLCEQSPAGRRLLDVACGTGESLLPFRRRGYEVTGCDISAAMLEQARAKDPSIPLLRLDARELPERPPSKHEKSVPPQGLAESTGEESGAL